MPRFAANLTMMFNEVPFPGRFAAAAAAGFRGVEYLFPYEFEPDLLAERLGAAKLEQVLFNLPPGDWEAGERGLAALPGREGEFQDGLGRALDYARALGCAQLHAMAGVVPEGADPEACALTYRDNLRAAAEATREHGITLLIEPINSRDMPGYFLTTTAQARETIAGVGSPDLGLQYDVYHAQVMEGDLAATIEANLDLIRHIQISSLPGRHEPDQGEINYPFLFDHLDAKGYEGWIGCEYRPRGGTADGLGWARRYGIGS